MRLPALRRALIGALLFAATPAVRAQVTDIDGNRYPTVSILGNNWMTENLNTTRFRNGDPIAEARTEAEWQAAIEGKKPAWRVDPKQPALGRIYNGWAVSDTRGLAPEGYSIPAATQFDVSQLNASNMYIPPHIPETAFLGSGYERSGLYNDDCAQSNTLYITPEGRFDTVHSHGLWWLLEENDLVFCVSRCTGVDGALFAEELPENWRAYGFYVRCVKRGSAYPVFGSVRDAWAHRNEPIDLGLSYRRAGKFNDSISQLSGLRNLVLPYNSIASIPASIGNLQQLEYLNLAENRLTALPGSIGQLKQLKVLDLSDNRLVGLPASLAGLQQLEYLNLKGNKDLKPNLQQLAALPRLKRLGLPAAYYSEAELAQIKKLFPHCVLD